MKWVRENKMWLAIAVLVTVWLIATQRHADQSAAFEECRVQHLDYHHDQAKYSICLDQAGVDHHGERLR